MDFDDALEISIYSLTALGMCTLIYFYHILHHNAINQDDAVEAVGENDAAENI